LNDVNNICVLSNSCTNIWIATIASTTAGLNASSCPTEASLEMAAAISGLALMALATSGLSARALTASAFDQRLLQLMVINDELSKQMGFQRWIKQHLDLNQEW